jgi:hypothetical protein
LVLVLFMVIIFLVVIVSLKICGIGFKWRKEFVEVNGFIIIMN